MTVTARAVAAVALLGLAACDDGTPPGWSSSATRELRPDNARSTEMFRFDANDVAESLASPSGEFRIHYTRTAGSRHAVPSADADADGVPDAVERIAALYDEIIAFYRMRGFRAPISDVGMADNGGDAAFDVYLVDFARAADGAYRREACRNDAPSICSGYMVQENDFVGYGYPSIQAAERTVASHELFHAIQAAYDADQGSLLAEGTAEWATEQFDPSLTDFENQIRGYFTNADRSIDKPLPGPVDAFSYGSAIFFQSIGEQLGHDTIRALIEATEDGAGGVPDPMWFALLPGFLEAHASSFAEVFTTFIEWNLYTGNGARAGYGYANARAYPTLTRTSVSAPVEEQALRVFYASAQAYRINPGGRDPLDIALVAEDVDGLLLLTAPAEGGVLRSPPTRTPSLRISIPTTGVDAVTAVIVNLNTSGNSKRPTLCAGDPAEVAACVARNGGPAVDAGVSEDAASSPDDAQVTAPDAGTMVAPDAAAASDAGPPPIVEASSCAAVRGGDALAVVLVALAIVRRRRRAR